MSGQDRALDEIHGTNPTHDIPSGTLGLLEDLVGRSTPNEPGSLPAPVKAIAWARVSSEMQKERKLSIEAQLRDIRVYAQKEGIEVVAEYSEVASAFQRNHKRAEFERMIAQAKADPQVTAILVHDYSRFSRDSISGKALLRELRELGIRVISLNDPDIDPESVAGVYMEAFTFAKNEAYSREIAFHTKKGCKANLRTRDPETGWCYKNGGQPLWGYRPEHLERGQEKKGRPLIKTIWVLDESVVAGRPVHEWVRHCLVELAAKGASLDELRDFCNRTGIPARRQPYWGTSSWNALLQPHVLLQYCGYGVWDVHGKRGVVKPPSEWVIVERAQPAIITEDEARAIGHGRRRQSLAKRFDEGCRRSRSSQYLLSGGLFKCGRCGSNMVGFRTYSGTYYVCGSQPYRRGLGCGPGVYVPKEQVEAQVVEGLKELVSQCADPDGFTKRVNEELVRLWQESNGHDPLAASKLEETDDRIANIRRAIEEGLTDAEWANKRLAVLFAQRQKLAATAERVGEPPQIAVETALLYRRRLDKILAQGTHAERKSFVRTLVDRVKLVPERLEVEIKYSIPELSVDRSAARAFIESSHNRLGGRFVRRWSLPRRGRHPAFDNDLTESAWTHPPSL